MRICEKESYLPCEDFQPQSQEAEIIGHWLSALWKFNQNRSPQGWHKQGGSEFNHQDVSSCAHMYFSFAWFIYCLTSISQFFFFISPSLVVHFPC